MSKRLRLLFGLSIILLAVSCKEETRINVVEGLLYYDCDFILGESEVALKANGGSAFTEPLILATAICDQNGYFRMTYELEEDKSGRMDLIVVQDVGYSTVMTGIPLNKDHQLRAYFKDQSTYEFELTGNYWDNLPDTFFYSIESDGKMRFKVDPGKNFMDTLYPKLKNVFNPQDRGVRIYYGVGREEFRDARDSVRIQGGPRRVGAQIGGCKIDTVVRVKIWRNN